MSFGPKELLDSGVDSGQPRSLLHVILFQPCIPQNTGNIARLCVGFRIHLHLVRPLGFDISDRAVKRAGLDYWKDLRLSVHEGLDDALQEVAGTAYYFSTHASRPYHGVRFVAGDALVFGPETTGFSTEFRLAHSEAMLNIPLRGPVRSLNLSNAVAIASAHALLCLQPGTLLEGALE